MPNRPLQPPATLPPRKPTRSAPGRGRRALFRLGAIFVTLVSSCAIGELGLRLCGYTRSYINPGGSFHEYHPLVGTRGKPNFSGRFRQADFDILVCHDALGFRRQEPHPELPEPKRDIYVLGDSFVWGYGVGQNDIFTNRLSVLMPGYRVHNFGLTGSGTVEQYTLFKHYVYEHLRPGDTVVLAFYGNDFGDNVGRSPDRIHAAIEDGRIVLVPPPPPSRWADIKSKLKDISCLFNLVTCCIDRYKVSGARVVSTDRAYRPTPTAAQIRAATSDAHPQVIITRHYLGELKRACDGKQARLLVAYVPGQSELGEDDISSTEDLTPPENPAYRRAFFRSAQALQIETLDLLPALLRAKQAEPGRRLTFAHDFHWQEHGHAVAAQAISAAILRDDGTAVASTVRH